MHDILKRRLEANLKALQLEGTCDFAVYRKLFSHNVCHAVERFLTDFRRAIAKRQSHGTASHETCSLRYR